MSTLTGQQINNTYDGLLKLSDSTTGITSTFQAIEDGLGNDTNSKISTQGFIAPNIVYNNNLKPDYGGTGFQTGAGPIPVANTQNKVLYSLFYDPGFYSYSAITYQLGTLTTTSDVVSMAFYSLQAVNGIGYAPKDLLYSGITLISTGTTGVKTTTLPSTLSFSGTGGGYYVCAVNISNAGVTPSVRYGANLTGTVNQLSYNFGFYLNSAGTALQIGNRYVPAVTTGLVSVLNSNFLTTFTPANIVGFYQTSIITANSIGFGLNTIF